MKIEELKELLGSAEGKQLFNTLAKELGYESPDEVQGLRTKRDELLGKVKNLNKEKTDLEAKISDVDFEEYQIFKEKGTGNKIADEAVALKRQLNVLDTKFKEETANRIKIESAYDNKLKESELSKIFSDINIDPKHAKLLTSAFKDKVKTEGDYDKRELIVDVDGSGLGLPAAEYFKKWVADEGKPYVRIPENRGTGSHQFSTKNAKVISRNDFNALPLADQSSLVGSGVTIE